MPNHVPNRVALRVGSARLCHAIIASVRDLSICIDFDASMKKTHVNPEPYPAASPYCVRPAAFVDQSRSRLCNLWRCPWYWHASITAMRRWPAWQTIDSTDCSLRWMLAAARLVCSARKCDHITPLLQDLHWLRVPLLIEFESRCTRIPLLAWHGSAIYRAWNVPCGRHGLATATSFRFDARAEHSTNASCHRRWPRLRNRCSSHLE